MEKANGSNANAFKRTGDQMKSYIRTEIVQAEPENKGYRIIDQYGVVSWLPKGLFEAIHKEITNSERILVVTE